MNILIWQKTDLGFKAIIENMYSGLLYDSEIFQTLHTGDVLKAYVKQVREDGKIDLILQKPGFEKIDDFSKTLHRYITEHGDGLDLQIRVLPRRFMTRSVSVRRHSRRPLAICTRSV